jgi:hypothetical protein
MIHDPGGLGFTIREVWIGVARHADNDESIPALNVGDQWFPLIVADPKRLDWLKKTAKELSLHGHPIAVVKFSTREVLEAYVEGRAVFTDVEPAHTRTPPVTTKGPKDEPYPDFQRRVAEDGRRVKDKCDALDQFTPRCTACGETCHPIDAGNTCKVNGMQMISRWAEQKARKEFYRIGHFAHGAWRQSEEKLAALLDRVRAGEVE